MEALARLMRANAIRPSGFCPWIYAKSLQRKKNFLHSVRSVIDYNTGGLVTLFDTIYPKFDNDEYKKQKSSLKLTAVNGLRLAVSALPAIVVLWWLAIQIDEGKLPEILLQSAFHYSVFNLLPRGFERLESWKTKYLLDARNNRCDPNEISSMKSLVATLTTDDDKEEIEQGDEIQPISWSKPGDMTIITDEQGSLFSKPFHNGNSFRTKSAVDEIPITTLLWKRFKTKIGFGSKHTTEQGEEETKATDKDETFQSRRHWFNNIRKRFPKEGGFIRKTVKRVKCFANGVMTTMRSVFKI
jgi:hypothetical protein